MPGAINKWDILTDLRKASKSFGLSNRELTVLQALLSFHPGTDLDPVKGKLIVFPSNATLCDRLNGMPCSTMRRHLARLVSSGLILRRDSPNGKRYRRRADGNTFGFDLTPLLVQRQTISKAADRALQEEARIKELREDVMLMRRDLIALANLNTSPTPRTAAILAEITEDTMLLRRKLGVETLERMAEKLTELLAQLHKLSSNDAQNEQHIHRSDTDHKDKSGQSELTLKTTLETCPTFQAMVEEPVRNWHQLIRAAHVLSPMMGIGSELWNEALEVLGPKNAAVVLVEMLERYAEIRNPGGYFRELVRKAKGRQAWTVSVGEKRVA